jgi:hypothetical protein
VSLSSGELQPATSSPPGAGRTQDPSRTAQVGESTRWRYGLFAVMGAVIVILAAFVFAALRYDTANDVSTALAAITGTVGTILGGYLGVQTGSQGKEESEAARQKAEARAVALAAAAPYEQALEALAIVEGRPVPARSPAGAPTPTQRSGSATRTEGITAG